MKLLLENKIPSHISQTLIVTRYEFLKFVKGKKLYGMICFAFFIPIILVSLPELMGGEYPENSSEFFSSQMNFLNIVIVISVSFFGSSAIVSEFHERTAYSLLPNPVNRISIWFGKFLTALLISFLIASIFYKITALGSWNIYGDIPEEIISSWGFSFLIVLMVSSISFLFSSILKGQTAAMVAVFILFILIFPMIEGIIIAFAEDKPWWIPSFISKITEFSFFSPYPSDLESGELPRGPFDRQRFVPYVDQSVVMILTYSTIASIVSIVVFNKKEMN